MADFDPVQPTRELQFPLYVKAPLVLLGLALLVFTLHIASEIIFPLFFAAIFAIMLHPVEQSGQTLSTVLRLQTRCL